MKSQIIVYYHQSRHNRVYWSGLGWWGFGQGSTSSPWGKVN